jgi:Fic family protein
VLHQEEHLPGREHDKQKALGYHAALMYIEKWALEGVKITENMIQMLHACVMSNGTIPITSTEYRDGPGIIKDVGTQAIVYTPPDAQEVRELMHCMISWINSSTQLPCPIIAGIAHYQFATIHPYDDGNGRTARLLTTLILHGGGYGLKGLSFLEEYYASNGEAYYEALSIGRSHNEYMGRAETDITPWIEYFVEGMAVSFENVLDQMQNSSNQDFSDARSILKRLDVRQRKALELLQGSGPVTSREIGQFFGLKPRASANLCTLWVTQEFLKVVDPSTKGRKYALSEDYRELIT